MGPPVSTSAFPEPAEPPPFIHSIGVFLGISTSSAAEGKYTALVQSAAHLFIENRWRLVYGGSSRGLMGIFARALHDAGGTVRGFKPRAFLQYEPDGVLPAWGHIELVEDIHTQKRRMAELSDAFVIFPGGLGTLEEFVAVQMWVKLGVCTHPVILFNFEGYYDSLLKWMGTAREEGFVAEDSLAVITVVDTLDQLNTLLKSLGTMPRITRPDPFTWSILSPEAGKTPDFLT
ncbi:hypothetical protein MMC13_002585 [Lambiella insularis]|nr:hypothetical protein [Lambiella insularis]